MSANHLVLDLDSFTPIQCDEPLRSILGYRSEAEIFSDFSSVPHLHNMSFLRLYELGLQGRAGQVRLLNRQGRVAGTIRQVTVSSDRKSMMLDVEPNIAAKDSTSLHQLVSLQLDANMIITQVLAGDVEPRDLTGREFSRAIAPIGWSGRLDAIYRDRFRKADVCRLRHPTILTDGKLYRGQWLMEKLSVDAWKADFYSLETAATHANNRMLITLRGQRTEIAMDSGLLALAPVSMEFLPPRLEDYLLMVLPEDRSWVRRVLCCPYLPEEHQITYRIAGPDGVVQVLRHRLRVQRAGRGIQRIDSHLSVVSTEEMAMVSLKTMAIAFDLNAESSDQVCLPNFHRLGPNISRLRALLKADGFSDDITVARKKATNCSICDHTTGHSDMLVLSLDDMTLSRAQLHRLTHSDRSMFNIGSDSNWKSWFAELHAAGFHLSIGLGDQEQVTIGVFADN
ncbi:MAG: hypothetical protein JJ934_03010 [Pseudomonadales bacterium]|nr:hypothetical protein [Pseudomonadales bacterium]MBO6595270.1 hypothetical protein [Pseudomonadales bacterium]MBO6655835.1 hypothetical protein [Pseudomonadales bacterium]MBO6821171.1 hypothetical protein [Pseudomonadales bacterium]